VHGKLISDDRYLIKIRILSTIIDLLLDVQIYSGIVYALNKLMRTTRNHSYANMQADQADPFILCENLRMKKCTFLNEFSRTNQTYTSNVKKFNKKEDHSFRIHIRLVCYKCNIPTTHVLFGQMIFSRVQE